MARRLGSKRLVTKVAAGSTTANFTLERDVLELEGVNRYRSGNNG